MSSTKIPNKGIDNQKISRNNKKEKSKNRSIVQEVIDLDAENDELHPDPSQNFIGDIAKKCNTFFSWLSNTSSPQLAEHLWKQKMLEQASLRFPDFNNEELIRLIDRDWNYMTQEDKQVPKSQQIGINRSILSMSDRGSIKQINRVMHLTIFKLIKGYI